MSLAIGRGIRVANFADTDIKGSAEGSTYFATRGTLKVSTLSESVSICTHGAMPSKDIALFTIPLGNITSKLGINDGGYSDNLEYY